MWFAAAFVTAFVADVLWVMMVQATTAKRTAKAVFISMAMCLTGGVAMYAFVSNPWLIIPELAGTALGTVVAMRMEHNAAS